MKRQQGFTLIELVMSIVILGILSVTAAPMIANLGDGAKYSKFAGTVAAVNTASGIVHSKAVTSGVSNGTITLDGTDITVVNGYASATSIFDAAGVDSTEIDRVLYFVSDQVVVFYQGVCVSAYFDAGYTGTAALNFGVINSVNNTCP